MTTGVNRRRRTFRRRALGLATMLALGTVTACGGAGYGGGSAGEGGQGFPTRDLSVIAAGSPGGGLDGHARMLTQSITEAGLSDANFQIENIGGGGGNPARASLLKRSSDGHAVVVESNRIFLAPLIGTTKMEVQDFTPIAKLSVDYLIWAVRADSQFDSAEEILRTAKKNPKSVSFGVGTVPSDDQLNILQASDAYGITDLRSLNIVAFESGGDLMTKLLGGHVDVVSTGLSEVAEQVEAGKVRLLAISAEQPQGGIAEGVPTWNQLGLDFSLDHWRGVFGPADMPKEAVTWWTTKIRKATKSDAWQQEMEKLQLTTDFETGKEFRNNTILRQKRAYQDLLAEVGLLKK